MNPRLEITVVERICSEKFDDVIELDTSMANQSLTVFPVDEKGD